MNPKSNGYFWHFWAILGYFRAPYYNSFLNQKLFRISKVKIAFKKLFWFLIKKSVLNTENVNFIKTFDAKLTVSASN